MKPFEFTAPVERRDEHRPHRDAFDALEEQRVLAEQKGRELSIEQQLLRAHALRAMLLDSLMELESLRHRQQAVRSDQLESLRFMLANQFLEDDGRRTTEDFLSMDQEFRSIAFALMRYLQQTDEEIGRLEDLGDFSIEDQKQRAEVRRRHRAVYESEWGVQK